MFVDIADDAEFDLEEIGDFIARNGSPKRAERLWKNWNKPA